MPVNMAGREKCKEAPKSLFLYPYLNPTQHSSI